MGKLVILSGPSCAGKGPLCCGLRKFYPELVRDVAPVVVYNSRDPRPGERDGVDYHFLSRSEIEAFRGRADFTVMDVRGDLQALDLGTLNAILSRGDALFEGNPFIGKALLECPLPAGAERVSVFLAPLSREEITMLQREGVDVADFVTNVQRAKLLRRTKKQKEFLALKDLQEIERRAASAYCELREAHHFGTVIVNHDAEGSENWDQFYYPIGDARKTLLAFAALLRGKVPEQTESWDRSLLP